MTYSPAAVGAGVAVAVGPARRAGALERVHGDAAVRGLRARRVVQARVARALVDVGRAEVARVAGAAGAATRSG